MEHDRRAREPLRRRGAGLDHGVAALPREPQQRLQRGPVAGHQADRDLDDVPLRELRPGVERNFDRANVRAVDAKTGEKVLLTPTGALYTTTSGPSLLCDNLGNLKGWSGSAATWRLAGFDLSPYAGKGNQNRRARVDRSRGAGHPGFWMDLSPDHQRDPDQLRRAGRDLCRAPPEVSPEGALVPLTIDKSGTDLVFTFSESAGATGYNLYRGRSSVWGRGSTTTPRPPGSAESWTAGWVTVPCR